jgi:hypothetical protein
MPSSWGGGISVQPEFDLGAFSPERFSRGVVLNERLSFCVAGEGARRVSFSGDVERGPGEAPGPTILRKSAILRKRALFAREC